MGGGRLKGFLLWEFTARGGLLLLLLQGWALDIITVQTVILM